MQKAFAGYAYYLAKVGTPSLPNALTDVAAKLIESGGAVPLDETAVFYLEEILRRLTQGVVFSLRAGLLSWRRIRLEDSV
jgi:hypothetical protein